MSKRVDFTFDECSLKTLEQPMDLDDWADIAAQSVFPGLSGVRRVAPRSPLRSVSIRDPETGEEREVWIPPVAVFVPLRRLEPEGADDATTGGEP